RQSGGDLLLRHVTVEYGSLGVDYRVSGEVVASVTIEDSLVRYSGGNGIYAEASNGAALTALVRNNEIHDHSGSGIALVNNSGNSTLTPTLTENLVYATATGVTLNNNGSGTLNTPAVTGNELRENRSDGLFISNNGTLSGLSVIDNKIDANSRYGLYISNNGGTAGEPSISGNRISGSSNGGIYVTTYGDVASLWRIAGNEIQTNSGTGLDFYYSRYYGAGVTVLVRDNLIADNSGRGVYLHDYCCYYSSGGGKTKAQLNLNRIQGNGSWGIQASQTLGMDIVHNQLSDNQGGGIYLTGLRETTRINFNDLGGDNGSYEVQNADGRAVDARYNWWGDVTAAEMAAGGNPKDIVRIYDIFNDNGLGAVDYGQYLVAAPTLIEDPVSWVKSPPDGATLKAETVRIEGSASAAEDIDRVEVSTDGGVTWVVAAGTLSWSYDWAVPGDGSYLLRSRVVTAGGVAETPGDGNRITLD
ncbi:MAG: hypothetical protein EOM24_26990, partial [Chloroflexia bacterium]|nr:hypothetical protein [Chloroflexia bacterium]